MLIFYQNVNRIRSKTVDIFLNVLNSSYDIICLTETNLNDSIYDGELFDTRYNVVRRDRHESSSRKSEGGGVLIAIKKSFKFTRQVSWESQLEDLWIRVLPNSTDDKVINICLCYIPPDLPMELVDEFYTNLQNVAIQFRDTEEFLCIGDFNIPDIQWQTTPNSNVMIPSERKGRRAEYLFETLEFCGLNQFNNILNKNDRLLDLVISSVDSISVSCAVPLSKEDKHHPPILIDIDVIPPNLKPFKDKNSRRLNFFKSNYVETCTDLALLDWEEILSLLPIDEMTNAFYTELKKIIKKHTPFTKDEPNKYPSWFSPSLKQCLREKQKHHRRFKKFKNPRDYDSYSLLRARCKKLINKDYKNFISSVESSLKTNLKNFWRFVNNKKKNCNSIPQTMKYGNLTSSDQGEVCELFSSYFASVFDTTTAIVHQNDLPTRNPNVLNNIVITRENIESKLIKLDANKGAGPDGIPPMLIKRCSKELSVPLQIIFNASIQAGIFPTEWKTAHIIPIHKSGDKSKCENYRPISILSCLGKVFESLVYDALYYHFQPFLSARQHGFMRNRSTTSNLLEYKNYLCDAFDKTVQVDSIYTDFSKAFDKVNHQILCAKLASYGLHGNLLRWVESYLRNRSQLVAIKGFTSSPAPVGSGVPQGSHLGPLFFIVFINDLVDQINCPCLLYADDLKIYSTINGPGDCHTLQADLHAVREWCVTNRMYLNVDKCFVLCFGNKKSKILFDYHLNGHTLERKTAARDLGVIFDEKLSFHAHYDEIVSRCSRLLGFICRITRDFRNPSSLLYLFNSLVRSILEYNTSVWSPNYAVHSDRIEKIQKRFLAILCRRCGLNRSLPSYRDKLQQFNIVALETRRRFHDLTYLFKLIHSIVDCPNLLSQININIQPRIREPFLKTFTLQVYKNKTSHFNPIARMCRLYNELLVQNYMLVDIFDSRLPRFRRSVLDILVEQYIGQ